VARKSHLCQTTRCPTRWCLFWLSSHGQRPSACPQTFYLEFGRSSCRTLAKAEQTLTSVTCLTLDANWPGIPNSVSWRFLAADNNSTKRPVRAFSNIMVFHSIFGALKRGKCPPSECCWCLGLRCSFLPISVRPKIVCHMPSVLSPAVAVVGLPRFLSDIPSQAGMTIPWHSFRSDSA